MEYVVLNNVILTDADGVLLNWEYAFDCWMEAKGYFPFTRDIYDIKSRYNIEKKEKDFLVRAFNESAAIGFLPPHRDAIHYVRKLHEEHGYIFKVITSLSLEKHAGRLRRKNLNKMFGTAIEEVVCLDTGADKDEALAPYKGSGMIWIEDKPENADLGAELGLQSYLMEHKHNMLHNNDDVTIVKNWKEIYELITQTI